VGPRHAAGGGGGGGGALLIASNGTITINGLIHANGGFRGDWGTRHNHFSTRGGGGSGGAIRLIGQTIAGSGSVSAIGGSGHSGTGGKGKISLEAFNITLPVNNTNPQATREPVPGPLVNALVPVIAITKINGEIVSDINDLLSMPPMGGFGAVDVTVSAPGSVTIEFKTSGVPSGTVVRVVVKPRLGVLQTDGTPVSAFGVDVTLNNCNAGDCTEMVDVDLPVAETYFIEARATYQTP